jgi:hypothetical protein
MPSAIKSGCEIKGNVSTEIGLLVESVAPNIPFTSIINTPIPWAESIRKLIYNYGALAIINFRLGRFWVLIKGLVEKKAD